MEIGGLPIVYRNYGLVVSLLVFVPLSTLAALLRVYTRAFLVKNFGPDDGFLCLSVAANIAYTITIFIQIKYGLGHGVNPEDAQNFSKALLSTVATYTLSHFAFKLSIVLQCRRIFIEKRAQRIFGTMVIYLLLYGAFCVTASIVTCVPIAKYWDPTIPGSCLNRATLHYVFAGINIVNDIIILTSPMPFLTALQIPKKSKIVLFGVFACGGFACIVAIIRLHALYILNSNPISDGPMAGVDIALWSGLEVNTAITCAAIPALKPLISRFFPSFFRGSSYGDSSFARRYAANDGSRAGGGNRHASLHLRSLDKRVQATSSSRRGEDDDSIEDLETGRMEIKVHQSFEMKTMAMYGDGDDSSQKNLVTAAAATGANNMSTHCYAAPTSLDVHDRPNSSTR